MSELLLFFTVPGMARPQGSKRPMKLGNGSVVLREMSARLPDWRARVAEFASRARGEWYAPAGTAVGLELTFYVVRPKSHYGKRKGEPQLRPDAPRFPVGSNVGDIDKLCRAALDALTGVLYDDDKQVATLVAFKRFGDVPQLTVHVKGLAT